MKRRAEGFISNPLVRLKGVDTLPYTILRPLHISETLMGVLSEWLDIHFWGCINQSYIYEKDMKSYRILHIS